MLPVLRGFGVRQPDLLILSHGDRDHVGGAAVTEEFHPGFRNSLASYTVSLLQPKVIADMRLVENGYRYLVVSRKRHREFDPDTAVQTSAKEGIGIEALLDLPDLLLFSRAYAEARGYPDAPALLHALRPQCPRALLVCAWGMLGAAVMDRHGSLWESPAFVPPQVMDTLGAGDVFNAGFIDGLLRGGAPRQALDQACRLAGRKCGQFGLEGLGGQFGS